MDKFTPTLHSDLYYFNVQHTQEIERNVSQKHQFIEYLRRFLTEDTNQSNDKTKKIALKNLDKLAVQQSLVNCYSYMTENNYTIEQKTITLNLLFHLFDFIGHLQTHKQSFKQKLRQCTHSLSKRFKAKQKETEMYQYQPPYFNTFQSGQLYQFLHEQIFLTYQMWEVILDQSEQFTLQSEVYKPIQIQIDAALSKGTNIEPTQIPGLPFLKQYLGQKLPLEEKKDPKKK